MGHDGGVPSRLSPHREARAPEAIDGATGHGVTVDA